MSALATICRALRWDGASALASVLSAGQDHLASVSYKGVRATGTMSSPALVDSDPSDFLEMGGHDIPVCFGGELTWAADRFLKPEEMFSRDEARLIYERLRAAGRLLEAGADGSANFTGTFTRTLVCVRDTTDGAESFGSSSDGRFIGRNVIVNPHSASVAQLAEGLLHESVHSALYVANSISPWLPSASVCQGKVVVSPWTGNQLSPQSYMQAIFVWWGLYWFVDSCRYRTLQEFPYDYEERAEFIRTGFTRCLGARTVLDAGVPCSEVVGSLIDEVCQPSKWQMSRSTASSGIPYSAGARTFLAVEMNRLSSVEVLIESRAQQNAPDVLAVHASSLGNINNEGSSACWTSPLLSPLHPQFWEFIEPGVSALVSAIVQDLSLLTYSSCQGHPANDDAVFRPRHVGVLATSPSEFDYAFECLDIACWFAIYNVRPNSAAPVVRWVPVHSTSGTIYSGVDLIILHTPGTSYESYWREVEDVSRALVDALKQ